MPASSSAELRPLWIVNPRNRAAEDKLQSELGVPSIVAAVLAQRGLTDPAIAHAFLNPSLDQLHSPYLLPDYAKARDAILGAKERNELIYIHGDYDVDGVTSAAIFNRFLLKIGCRVHTHVPHRMKEGYGIHTQAVIAAKEMGAKLFLTCDCGIGAHDQVTQAKEAGMVVVVTDHHTVGASLPDADAIVNPHRSDSEYPFTELSGAGLAFKLCQGLTQDLGLPLEFFHRAYLDLAALGTIADIMPLVGENRVIARFGLEQLAVTKKVGLQALMRVAGIALEPGKRLRAGQVGWQLGPRLNAAGRIDDADLSLRLLLENDIDAANALAQQIESVNTQRKLETQRVVDQAIEMVLETGAFNQNVIVVGHENWHAGIVGIAAGKIAERFHRPSFVFTLSEITGLCKSSARSYVNFHLADAIRALPELMQGGGHAAAAGCSFEFSRLEEVREALNLYAGERLTEEDFRPSIFADMEVTSDELNMISTEALQLLEPFGQENPEPLFLAKGITLTQVTALRNPIHAKAVFRQGTLPSVGGIAFNIGQRLCEAGSGSEIDVLFQPSINEYRGSREFQWQVRDFTVA